jgi:orotidine-5'-phosphate decarboxylase
MKANDKLFVALDVDSAQEALDLVDKLYAYIQMFKIGSKLFTAAGPDLVREIVARDAKVFLDLKFHDIPNTVAAAAVEAARLGVFLFTVHAAGGKKMMSRAIEAASEAAVKSGKRRPLIVGVTVLTSADQALLQDTGVARSLDEQVAGLAQLADTAGLDGVVASPHEVRLIRTTIRRPDFLIVTPGVRPTGGSADDQSRVMTPAEAVKAGADFLVVGRSIITAADPVASTRQILEQIEDSWP